MKKIFLITISLMLVLAGCRDDDPKANPITYGEGYMAVQLSTDKAAYKPGEVVKFSLNDKIDGTVKIRYKHMNNVVKEENLSSTSWTWAPPVDDYKGYLVDLYTIEDGKEVILGSIAVDVSSEPTRFPRNGFLSYYSKMSAKDIDKVIGNLNRHHINYVQYQDWHYKHHMPLAGTPSSPMTIWTDIVNRDTYLETVKGYIDATHRYGMKSLFYNLAYGALSDAAEDGVKEDWYLFKDRNHANKDYHPLGSPFKSNIYLVNPFNQGWIDYMIQRNNDVYAVFDFDGYQIDQLGGRGDVYDYFGNSINLASTFNNFIQKMKQSQPSKSLVMNAVGQYGQEGIAPAPVDFLYTEVWGDQSYKRAAEIITDNDRMSNNTKKTVLAAYINYDLSNSRGYFNTPGVLFANAVFHAWGGAHLALGEHMLSNEYFPNNNRTMDGELKIAMIAYYDFITAYENLLRDGGDWVGVDVVSLDGKATFNQWPPQKGSIATVGKDFGNRRVVHLLNFTNAYHLEWVDRDGTQTKPVTIINAEISIPVTKTIKSVWVASPDSEFGVARSLDFVQEGNTVKLTLPQLKYWDMLVLE